MVGRRRCRWWCGRHDRTVSVHDPARDRGAALIIAIGFVVMIGAIAAGLTSMVTSGVGNRIALEDLRDRQYAADGAIEDADRDHARLPRCRQRDVRRRLRRSSVSLNGVDIRVESAVTCNAVLGRRRLPGRPGVGLVRRLRRPARGVRRRRDGRPCARRVRGRCRRPRGRYRRCARGACCDEHPHRPRRPPPTRRRVHARRAGDRDRAQQHRRRGHRGGADHVDERRQLDQRRQPRRHRRRAGRRLPLPRRPGSRWHRSRHARRGRRPRRVDVGLGRLRSRTASWWCGSAGSIATSRLGRPPDDRHLGAPRRRHPHAPRLPGRRGGGCAARRARRIRDGHLLPRPRLRCGHHGSVELVSPDRPPRSATSITLSASVRPDQASLDARSPGGRGRWCCWRTRPCSPGAPSSCSTGARTVVLGDVLVDAACGDQAIVGDLTTLAADGPGRRPRASLGDPYASIVPTPPSCTSGTAPPSRERRCTPLPSASAGSTTLAPGRHVFCQRRHRRGRCRGGAEPTCSSRW